MAFRKYNFFKKFLDFITGFAAFLTVLLILFNFIVDYLGVWQSYSVIRILGDIQTYAFWFVLFLVGLEFFSTKNWFLLIVYVLLASAAFLVIWRPEWMTVVFDWCKRLFVK